MGLINRGRRSFLAKPQDSKKSFCSRIAFAVLMPLMAVVLIGVGHDSFAQDGNAGIAEATNKVKGYFDTGCDLMYAIGAVVGIIGAVKVLCAMN